MLIEQRASRYAALDRPLASGPGCGNLPPLAMHLLRRLISKVKKTASHSSEGANAHFFLAARFGSGLRARTCKWRTHTWRRF